MKITGRRLGMVHQALIDKIGELHNDIVTCPDEDDPEFKPSLAKLRKRKSEYERLAREVAQAITKENNA